MFLTPLMSTLPASGPLGLSPGARPVNLSPQPHPVVVPMGPSPPSQNHVSPGKEVASPGQTQGPLCPSPGRGPSTSTSPGPCCPGSPLQLTPVLVEAQILRLAEAADQLVRSLPQFEPKPHNTKKKICKDLEVSHINSHFTFINTNRPH